MPFFKGAFGLNPQKTHQGAGHTGVVETYAIHPSDPNAYFRGTPVKLAGRTNPHGIPYVVLAEPGDALAGVITEWQYIPSRNGINFLQGGPALPMVVVDPMMRYHVMADADLDIHDYKCFANLTCETGDKHYGISCVMLDTATVGPDPTKQVRIHRTVQAPWNMGGPEMDRWCRENDKVIVEVSINVHQNTVAYSGCPADMWDDECEGPDEVDCDGDGIADSMDPEPTDPNVTGVDADGDGADAAVDADDNDATVQ